MDGTAQGWGMDSLGEWWRHGGVMSWSSSWLTFIMFVDVNSLEKGWEHVAEKTSQFTVLKSEKCWYPMISAFCRSYPYVWFETKPWVMIWDHAWNLVMSGGKPSHYRLPSYDPLLAMMICGSHEISSACIYIYYIYIYTYHMYHLVIWHSHGKSLIYEGFNGKIIYKWAIFHDYVK
jgi:hypothetical protein